MKNISDSHQPTPVSACILVQGVWSPPKSSPMELLLSMVVAAVEPSNKKIKVPFKL